MRVFSASPVDLLCTLRANKELYWALLKRDITGRYKGSFLGLFWSLLHPLFMLSVYAFVFGEVFQSRWSSGPSSTVSYAVVLFCGLIVFNLFSEVANRAPQLIVDNANYVKKVVFPLELLPLVCLGTSTFHALVSWMVWLIFHVLVVGVPNPSVLLFPLIVFPLLLLLAGLGWFMASLGVFLRDISQVVGVVTSALLFLSPVFFPLSAVPESFRILIELNPLTHFVEEARSVLIYGRLPSLYAIASQVAFSAGVAWIGFVWFQRTRKGFADVI